MATIRYTHGFDLLYQLAFWIGTLALTFTVSVLIEPIWDTVSQAGVRFGIPEWIFTTLTVLGLIGILGSSGFILLKTILKPGLPAYLYVRLELLTSVTWKETENVAFLFSGDANGKWYPLRELRKIPRKYRREVLFEFAEKILREKYRPQFTSYNYNKNEPPPGAKTQPDSALTRHAQYCAVLGVQSNATIEQIKEAYRTKIKRFHPDLFATAGNDLRVLAEEKTKEINAAFAYLENAHTV